MRTTYRYTGKRRWSIWRGAEIELVPGRFISKALFDALPAEETIAQERRK